MLWMKSIEELDSSEGGLILRSSTGIVLGCLVCEPAFAYLDPGTGSILIQGLIAAIAGGLFAIKAYWHRLKGFFSKSSRDDSREKKEEEPPQSAAD